MLDPSQPGALAAAKRWLDQAGIGVLNVAGPRESERPGSYRWARRLLDGLLAGRFPRGARPCKGSAAPCRGEEA